MKQFNDFIKFCRIKCNYARKFKKIPEEGSGCCVLNCTFSGIEYQGLLEDKGISGLPCAGYEETAYEYINRVIGKSKGAETAGLKIKGVESKV